MNRPSKSRVCWLLVCHLLFCLLVFGLSGCGEKQSYERVTAGSIGADEVLTPSREIMLTISGAIGRTNYRDRLLLDLATLERFGLVRYTIEDPWLLQDVAFTGVLMSTLLKGLDVEPGAVVVRLTALDDYQVDIPIEELERWPILLATRQNGREIPIAEGGPTRIVYPYHTYPKLDSVATRESWIWNVESIYVR